MEKDILVVLARNESYGIKHCVFIILERKIKNEETNGCDNGVCNGICTISM